MDTDSERALLNDVVGGSVDFWGRSSRRGRSGRWRSAGMIMGVEIAERFAFFGISSNMISYLTGQLGQPVASAAESVNMWCGTALLLPLLGAALADSCVGRYRTIVIASSLYIMGLGLLTLSATLPPPHRAALFFPSLYLIAVAQGGQKPCLQAFAADQFDADHAAESHSKCRFFNWWFFASAAGTLLALLFLTYVQDNLSWTLGFGIPCAALAAGVLVFLLGTPGYRFEAAGRERPVGRVVGVLVRAARNWRAVRCDGVVLEEGGGGGVLCQSSQQLRFVIAPDEDGKACTKSEVEEAKTVLRLIPIWATTLTYAVVLSQFSTFLVKQAAAMDRTLTATLQLPAAAIQSIGSLAVVLFLPLYDRALVPALRAFTRKPAGISPLQRIGVGMLISTTSMVVAAIVETKRLGAARDHRLVTVWFLVPQLVLIGVSTVFTIVGLQELFYDQVSSELKSIGVALCMSIFGVGNFMSGFLIYVVEDVSCVYGGESWFADDLDKGHLDYFYWFLAGLSEVGLVVYLYFANNYVYRCNVEREIV